MADEGRWSRRGHPKLDETARDPVRGDGEIVLAYAKPIAAAFASGTTS